MFKRLHLRIFPIKRSIQFVDFMPNCGAAKRGHYVSRIYKVVGICKYRYERWEYDVVHYVYQNSI